MSRSTILLGICIAVILQYCSAETPVVAEYDAKNKELVCNTEDNIIPLGNAINWYFNNSNTPIDFKKDEKIYQYIKENNTLVIKSIKPAVVARYTCKDASNETIQLHFDIKVPAFVIQPDKPRNVVEGDPLELECKAWGVPEPTIRWLFNGTQLSSEGSHGKIQLKKSKNQNFPQIENGTLRIENIAYEEAGDYTCIASNVVIEGDETKESNGTTIVNVKDKYAALWPFLGICVEVAVLCTIILIYEKRRAKRIEEEERQEEAAHLNANNDNRAPVSDDVRQRK